MSKKWIDANEIIMIHELPTSKLREIDKTMREKPNFNKTKNKAKKKRPFKLNQDKR